MKKRYELKCGVLLIIKKIENGKEYYLLQKRQNTGTLDNKYDFACSGHLEKGETLKEGIIRESQEEIGINVKKEDLQLVSLMHSNYTGTEYILATFIANNYEGVPSIKEPDKCSELSWYPLDNLPNDLIDTRRIMIENIKNGIIYSEYGFTDIEV